jgi:two-component system NtrC family sensor kinase
VAEDSRTQRRIYESFLKGDFEVALFENGRTLLDAVVERMPDLVISDLEMPVMDGLELTRHLKGDPATRPLPVILLTAGDGRSVSSCLDAGADDFLRKPVQADELAARARSCVRAFATYKELQANHGELRATYARLVQAEERTRASEARLSAILEGAHDAILTVDGGGHIASFNCAAERMFGWNRTEIGAIPFLELVSPGPGRSGLADRLVQLADGGIAERHEAVGRRRSGDEFPLECSLTRVDTADGPMVCAFLRDLTTSRQMEAALRQVQQLEAIGRMAGGIAHEINTPVQCIQDSLEFLRQSFEALEPVLTSYRDLAAAAAGDHAELVGRTRSAEEDADLEFTMEASPPAAKRALDMARRIVAIVRATQDFAGPEGGAGTVELHSTLRSVLEVSRPLYADVAEVELDAEPLLVPGHAGELNEAFRHLVLNAAHAIADAGRRGTIRVLARADGDDVVVSVSDNGCGVAPDIAHRIFDPFFTTKEVGRGVGLGLFVASAAARHHSGTLTFESEPGRGSTFRMRVARQRAAPNDRR